MRLNSIFANRHIFDGQVNGKPLRMLLVFDGDRSSRLQVAGDGWQMIVDDGLLEAPSDIGECGQIDLADATELVFLGARGLEVSGVEGLIRSGRRVGVKLKGAGGRAIHFWADGDELHWGDESALAGHDWLDGMHPTAGARIEI